MLAHKKLAHLPTPLHELTAMGEKLGVNLWIKRDDLTGLAFGGNKTRKLEFLIADAEKKGAKCVITAGMAQSNHCRQTAAAANVAQMDCHLVLGLPKRTSGNLFLDQILGATIHWCEKSERDTQMNSLAKELNAYVIPYGGSNAVGVCGYVSAMKELCEQTTQQGIHFDYIVVASSSGGTQAGLVCGAKIYDFDSRIIGISIDCQVNSGYEEHMCSLAEKAGDLLQANIRFTLDDFEVCYDYLGKGYGILGKAEHNAILSLAKMESIFVDPVYTGRAFAGLKDLVKNKKITGNVLFWHTGGTPALFAYREIEENTNEQT